MRDQGSSCRYYRAGQQLKRARHKVNLHPSVIANILGHKDPGIVFGVEDGDVRVPLEALPLLAKTLKVPLYQLQMIIVEYYPGFSNKVHEIVSRSIEPCPEDKVSVVIVLSAIENESRIM